MTGKAGHCCLYETLKGHAVAGHQVILILPRYHLFSDDLRPAPVPHEEFFEVRTATCSWLPSLKGLRSWLGRIHGRSAELRFVATWLLSTVRWILLTMSLCLAAVRVRYREKRRFDLVYAHNQYAALAGYLIAKMLRVSNVTRLYGTFLADLMKKPLVSLRYPVAASGFLVPHRLLICANDGTRGDDVARKLGVNMETFRFWQDGVIKPEGPMRVSRDWLLQRCPRGLSPRSVWVLTCSRLSYWKRMDRILRAVKQCRVAGCDCQLIVAGDGAEAGKLRSLARELGITSHVFWLGPVPHAEVLDLMALADVFMTTNDVTNRCNPLYEAICSGLPVASVRDPSTSDLLQDNENALLADRDDVEELGRALIRICTDPDLVMRMRKAQRERASRLWDWKDRMRVEIPELETLVCQGGTRPASPGSQCKARPTDRMAGTRA